MSSPPLTIGPHTLATPLTLAPMAGHTHRAYRDLVREQGGCGLVCSELISSNAMQSQGTRIRTYKRFDWDGEARPFAVQLFGNDPQIMADAARVVEDSGADIIDINMGCWVPKVAKTGGGAKLLKDVCTATSVVDAVVKAVDIPVTVKVRAGWERDNPTAIPFARAAEQSGVKAITVHWRFATQGFKGNQPDWSIIGEVKEAVSIPVFGNGDVHNAQDALRMVEQTGADGVMIGRAALGKPWLFRQIADELRTGEPQLEPLYGERIRQALEMARLTMETSPRDPNDQIRLLRRQLTHYTKGMPDASQVRERLVKVNSLEELECLLEPYAEQTVF